MSWRFDLKDASYGGLRIKVDAASFDFGREIIINDTNVESVPWKDGEKPESVTESKSPYVQDKGEIPQVFAVTIYFAGDNYHKERDEFIKLVNEGQPQTLQLPLLDPVTVIAGKGISSFRMTEGGYETIRIQFYKYSDEQQPASTANTGDEVKDETEESKLALFQKFAEGFKTGSAHVDSNGAGMQSLLGDSFLGTLYNGAKSASQAFEKVSELALKLSVFANNLIYDPLDLSNTISDSFTNLTIAFESPFDSFNAVKEIFTEYGAGIPLLGGDTEQELIAKQNKELQINTVNNAALLEMGYAISNMEFESLDQALTIKADYESLVRQQQIANGDYDQELYYNLSRMLSLVINHINNSADIPNAVTINYEESNPSLSVSADLYGNANRSDELVLRNNIRHPLFCSNELNVLSS